MSKCTFRHPANACLFLISLRFGSTYLNFHRHPWSNVSTFKIKYNAENARKTECYNAALESEKGQSIFFLTNVSNVWLKVFFSSFFFEAESFFSCRWWQQQKQQQQKVLLRRTVAVKYCKNVFYCPRNGKSLLFLYVFDGCKNALFRDHFDRRHYLLLVSSYSCLFALVMSTNHMFALKVARYTIW